MEKGYACFLAQAMSVRVKELLAVQSPLQNLREKKFPKHASPFFFGTFSSSIREGETLNIPLHAVFPINAYLFLFFLYFPFRKQQNLQPAPLPLILAPFPFGGKKTSSPKESKGKRTLPQNLHPRFFFFFGSTPANFFGVRLHFVMNQHPPPGATKRERDTHTLGQ